MALDRIGALLTTWEPEIRKAFLEAVRGLRNSVNVTDLTKLLKAGDIEGAIRAVGLDPVRFRALDLAVERAFEAGGADATLAIKPRMGPLGVRIAPVFDVREPAAASWLRGHTVDMIRQITDDQRNLVRAALAPLSSGQDAMLTGQTPQKIALDLVGRIGPTGNREGGLLGLTSQQATFANNYAVELGDAQANVPPSANALKRTMRDKRFDRTVARAIREGTPLTDETRQAMVASYRNRSLLKRGETIALNEASTALHEAQVQAWDQAIARGAVKAEGVRRVWITAGDDKVRPSHRAVPGMNTGGVGLYQPFNTPLGQTMQPGWGFDPGCRCRVRVRVVE